MKIRRCGMIDNETVSIKTKAQRCEHFMSTNHTV